jgi:hypothetical protein
MIGWAGRTRTFECQVQSLVPYQLGDRPAQPFSANYSVESRDGYPKYKRPDAVGDAGIAKYPYHRSAIGSPQREFKRC